MGTRPISAQSFALRRTGLRRLLGLDLLLGLLAVDLGGLLALDLGLLDVAPALVLEHGVRPPLEPRALRGRAGQREHGERVLARVAHDQPPAVAGDADGDRRRAEALRPLDRQRALDLHRLRVDHLHEVLVGDGHVDAIRLRVGRHPLGVREVRPDRDLLLLARAREVDHRDRPVGLVRDEALLAVARDRGAVRVAAGLHVLDFLRLGVDDRRAVREVERGQERLAVRADGEVARPRDLVGARGREVLRRRRVVGRGHLDHAVARRLAGLARCSGRRG